MRVLLLGAAGQLATRHTLPALASLGRADLHVVGIDRRPVPGLEHVVADLSAKVDLRPVVGDDPVVAYLALPPTAYAGALRSLHAAGLPAGSRVVVEKPRGTDLRSARELTRLLHDLVAERDVYRADHVLHHDLVQDLRRERWEPGTVARVDITWDETAGVTGRAESYDQMGALRDVVQSHLLQLLAVVAREPGPLQQTKAAVLRRVREAPHGSSVRGRYATYVREAGVDPARQTETHVQVQLAVDTPRWQGVPFVLQTGKRRPRSVKQVEVTLHDGSSRVFALGPPRDGRTASAKLLQDVLDGDTTLAVSADEDEECWRIVDSVRAGWA